MDIIFKAILWLVPTISHPDAQRYAELIRQEAEVYQISPLLVTAIVYKESRFDPKVSSDRNYGLMQVRVTRLFNRQYYGREHLLFDPKRNIWKGMEILGYWKGYHERHCGDAPDHPFWAHYAHGKRVRNPRYGERVKAIYSDLIRRFLPGEV